MPRQVKKILWVVIFTFSLVAAVGLSLWREAKRPGRVWVLASEKSISEADSFGGLGSYEYGVQIGKTENTTLRTEEKIANGFRARGGTCMVTHDKATADYRATISVTRTPGSVDHFGDAELSVVKRNGDVVLSQTFSQYRSFGEQDDIGQQPIKALTNLLCKKETL
jgi:hypothetical protein